MNVHMYASVDRETSAGIWVCLAVPGRFCKYSLYKTPEELEEEAGRWSASGSFGWIGEKLRGLAGWFRRPGSERPSACPAVGLADATYEPMQTFAEWSAMIERELADAGQKAG